MSNPDSLTACLVELHQLQYAFYLIALSFLLGIVGYIGYCIGHAEKKPPT